MTVQAFAKRGRMSDQITPLQYKRAWELVSTYHTTQQILAATGLTRPQLAWLMKVGNDAKGMPSFQRRLAEEAAIIRQRAKEAANDVGKNAVESLRETIEIQKIAQRMVRSALYAHLRTSVAPALERVDRGEGSAEDVAAMALPEGVRKTLRVLKPYTDFSEVASTFRQVFDSPHQTGNPLSGLPKGVRINLSGDTMGDDGFLPAAVALVEELDKGDVGHDLLNDLMPEYRDWTVEEIDRYLETGERPARDYGDTHLALDAEVVSTDDGAEEP